MLPQVPLVQKLPRYFSTLSQQVFQEQELYTIISDFARAINDPLDGPAELYVRYLIEKGKISDAFISGERKSVKRYLIGKPSIYEIATSLQRNGYISHQSAAYIHGLVEDEPLIVYVSSEGTERPRPDIELEQENIDAAFQKAQRHSGATMDWGNHSFLLLNSVYSNGAGIEKQKGFAVTNLERTLIDMCVRPIYAGGPKTILNAFRRSLSTLSMSNMIDLLNTLQFTYPYHQCIGFYLSQAGMNKKKLHELRKIPMPYTFYLDYEMRDPIFSDEWNIYFPNDLLD